MWKWKKTYHQVMILFFYSEFENQEALKDFQNHPLHEAHKKRCKDLVCKRLCGNIERK